MKLLFIVNPVAGKTSNDKVLEQIPQLAAVAGFEFKIVQTTGKNDDLFIQQSIEEYTPDRIVAGGGDGTIQLVARNMIGRKMPLGILPLGSANGFATATG